MPLFHRVTTKKEEIHDQIEISSLKNDKGDDVESQRAASSQSELVEVSGTSGRNWLYYVIGIGVSLAVVGVIIGVSVALTSQDGK